ncbi:MAG: methyltransferase domain-containing protein, partial [Actinomycetota bacterium]|nr:methyltransferase domain-containing protein [Actinomycetota bacterium]
FEACIAAMDVAAIHIGRKLGLYEALRDGGAQTSVELAERAGTDERYTREWLEHQAASGILDVENPDADARDRRFALPRGHDEALLDETSLNYVAPFGRFALAVTRPIDALMEAFRTGDGVPYEDYGEDLYEGQERFSRPLFDNLLGSEWLPAVPSIHERLLSDPPARVADVACGCGRSTIALARAYPNARVDGLDLDEPSIAKARRNLAGSGVEDRVAFHHRDAADPELAGRYDLALIFEALHDMSRPVDVLQAIRALLAEGGSVIVGDELVADRFTAPAGDVERFYYGISVMHCLPVGMVGPDPAGTGTVMRSSTLERYAREAGFAEVEILPIENEFWRFYHLRP